MVGDLGNGVRFRHGQRPIHTEADLGQETVSHPPCTDLGHSNDAVDCRHGFSDPGDDRRIDGVEETLADAPSRLIADDQDGSGDDKANHGVRPLRAERHRDGTDEHQQRGDAVSACVNSVRL